MTTQGKVVLKFIVGERFQVLRGTYPILFSLCNHSPQFFDATPEKLIQHCKIFNSNEK